MATYKQTYRTFSETQGQEVGCGRVKKKLRSFYLSFASLNCVPLGVRAYVKKALETHYKGKF